MAEAPIKGLTIRFGADTTEFTSRMNALGRVIGNVQTQIRAMDTALRGDQTSVTGLTEKFNLLRVQATNVALKMSTLREGIRDANAQGLDKLSASVGNTALYVQRMDANVKHVNQQLHDTYKELGAVGKEAGVAFGEKSKKNIDGWLERLKASKNVYPELIEKAEQLVQRTKDLKSAHEKATEAFEQAKDIRAYDIMKTDIAEAEVKMSALAREIVATNEAIDALGADSQKIERLGNEFEELKSDAQKADNELRQMNTTLRQTNYKNQEAYNRAVELTASKVKNARQQVDNLNEQLKLRQGQTGIERVNESMTSLTAKIGEAREKAVLVEKALMEQRAKVDSLKQSYDSYLSLMRDGQHITSNQAEAMGKLYVEMKKAEQEEKELVNQAKRANDELSMAKAVQGQRKLQGELTEAEAKLASLKAKANQFGAALMNSVRDFATGMGATIGPAVMMLGMHIVNAGDTIDSAFRDMRKTVDGTEKEFQHLKDAAIEFSKVHPVSADTILEIEAMGGQLGITVDKLEQFATTVSNLDIATNMNADEIAIDLGKLANVLHITNEEYDSFADSLVRLGNNFPAMESDIMNITTRFAGMSAIVGVLPDEVLAIATAATATGQKADAAGGALQRTFGRLEGAVAGVSDAMKNLDDMTEEDIEAFENAKDKLSAYADIAGVSSERFAALWEDSERLEEGVSGTTSAFQLFIEGLKRIDENGGSVDATLQKLGITGVRDRQLLEGLTNTTDILSDALHQSKEAWGDVKNGIASGGDAAREAEKKAEGFSGKLTMLKNTAQDAGAAFADKLVPLLDKLLDLARWGADAVSGMSDEFASFITVLGGLTIASAPMLRMFAQTKITADQFKNALGAAGVAAKGMEEAGEKASGVVGKMAVSLKNMTAKLAESNGAIGKVASGFLSMKAGAVAAATAITAIAVVAIANLINKQIEYYKATTRLNESLYATSGAINAQATSLGYGNSVYVSAGSSVRKLIESQAQLYDELSKTTEQTQTSLGMLEHWGDVLKANNDVSENSHAYVARLEDAVKHLNETYGMNLEVVKESGQAYVIGADGAKLNADAIDRLIDAKKREVQATALANEQAKIAEQQIAAKKALTEAELELSIATENYHRALAEGAPNIEDYVRDVEDAQKQYDAAKKSVDELNQSEQAIQAQLDRNANSVTEEGARIAALADQYPILAMKLDEVSTTAFPEFIAAMDAAGISTDELANVQGSDIDMMVKNWRSGTDQWVSDIENAKEKSVSSVGQMNSNVQKNIDNMKANTIHSIAQMTGITEDELWKMASEAGLSSAEAMNEWLANLHAAELPSGEDAEKMREAVMRELDRTASLASTSGDNVGKGFAYGISGWMDRAASIAYRLGKNAIDNLNAGAEVASPSKAAIRTGKFIDQGLIVGLEKDEKAVEKQASLVGSLATGALSAGAAASAGYLSARAGGLFGRTGSTTNNNNDNSTENIYITMNVEARDLGDMNSIDKFLAMARRAKDNYAKA